MFHWMASNWWWQQEGRGKTFRVCPPSQWEVPLTCRMALMYRTDWARSDYTCTCRGTGRTSSAIQQPSSPASQDTQIAPKPWVHREQEDGELHTTADATELFILQEAVHSPSVSGVNSCIGNLVSLDSRQLWYRDRALGCSLASGW